MPSPKTGKGQSVVVLTREQKQLVRYAVIESDENISDWIAEAVQQRIDREGLVAPTIRSTSQG